MFQYFLYKIGQFLALTFPRKTGYRIAMFFSDVHYIFAYKDRNRVKANLKTIFPDKSNREINRIRIRMFRNFAKYLVDFFRYKKLDKEFLNKNIGVEGINYYNEALAKGHGVIALTAHIGNWELGGAAISMLGFPFWAVVLPHKHKKVDRFFNAQRESKGIKIISLGRIMRQCVNVLKKNEILALVGDRDFTNNGIVVDFFGKPSLFPVGPAFFALKTGASIVPGFMLRNADDSFTLRMEKPVEVINTGNRDADLKEIILSCKAVIEDYVRRYPDQWYMFMPFWLKT